MLPVSLFPYLPIRDRRQTGKVALNVLKDAAKDDRSVPNLLTRELVALFDGRLPPRPRVRLIKKPGSPVWEILPA